MHAHHGPTGLFVCYLPGLDLRRIGPEHTPCLARLLTAFPSVRLRAQATHANAPTLFTGVNPPAHGAWGPRLRPDWPRRSPAQRMLDQLPDLATTTAQGLAHLAYGGIDLATMPPRRRRRFVWHRLNMKAIRDPADAIRHLDGVPSLFNIVQRSRYTYFDDCLGLDRALEKAVSRHLELDVIANHALDYFQHWNLHDEARIARFYRQIDAFVEQLHGKCERAGFGLVLMSDHGQEPVRRVVDPRPILRDLALPADAYDYFVEYAKMTLWFHSAEARARILGRLDAVADGVVVLREDLRRYDVDFADGSYGDALLYLRPGCSFFPNDFYQPLANAVLSVQRHEQRGRLRRPWHQGEHGYLPEADSELGFMVAVDDRLRATVDQAQLIDVAPTLLARLGIAPPPNMQGGDVFAARG